MSIASEFSGLPMNELIGAPLSAAADASIRLADSTAGFINKVGFDKDGKVRTAQFGYIKKSANEDGTSREEELKIDIPMLSIVPIPNLQVDEVNILFDMEVKTSEKKQESMDMEAKAKASIGFGFFKAEVSGSVSSHSSNTRSSDNSAKYHVDVKAANHGTPEGLARVLDMLAANVSPSLVGVTIKDANGGELSEEQKKKAENVQKAKQEKDAANTIYVNANKSLENQISILLDDADSQLRKFEANYEADYRIVSKDVDVAQEKIEQLEAHIEQVRNSWNRFKRNARTWIETLANDENATDDIAGIFALEKYVVMDQNNKTISAPTSFTKADSAEFLTQQNRTIAAQKSYNDAKKSYNDKDKAYSDALLAK